MPQRESTSASREIADAVLSALGEALGGDPPDLSETFGALGGDSLIATRVLARIWRLLDVRLPLSSLTPDTGIGAFVELVEAESRDPETGALTVDPEPWSETGPDAERLTPGQVAILLSAELSGDEGAAAATLPVFLRLRGALDREALRASLQALIDRHEALSLQIGDEGGGLAQRRCEVGLAELPLVEAGSEWVEVARRHAHLRIDPGDPPLLRPLLIRVGPSDHVLALALHHAACDGWSVGVLLRELAVLYGGTVTGAPPRLPEDAAGFLDFARWQRLMLSREQDRLVDFWHSTLEPLPFDRWLPTDFDRPRYRAGAGDAEHLQVGADSLSRLRAFSGAHGVTTFMSLLTAYAMVLADFADVGTLVVGVPMANRSHPLLEGTVGYLSNTVPVRLDLGGDPTVRELLGRVRRASLAAYDHEALPLSSLIAALAPPRDVSVPPVFQVCLVLNEMRPPEMHGLEVEPVLLHKGASPYDLTLYLEQRPASLDGYLEYPTDLFAAETMRELRRRLVRILGQMTADPDAKALGVAASLPREVL